MYLCACAKSCCDFFFSIGFSLFKVLLSFPAVFKKFAQSCSNSVWLDCAGSATLKSFTAINSTQSRWQPRRFWILPSLLPISSSTAGKFWDCQDISSSRAAPAPPEQVSASPWQQQQRRWNPTRKMEPDAEKVTRSRGDSSLSLRTKEHTQ